MQAFATTPTHAAAAAASQPCSSASPSAALCFLLKSYCAVVIFHKKLFFGLEGHQTSTNTALPMQEHGSNSH